MALILRAFTWVEDALRRFVFLHAFIECHFNSFSVHDKEQLQNRHLVLQPALICLLDRTDGLTSTAGSPCLSLREHYTALF